MANLGPLYQNQTYSNLLQVDGGLTAELKPVLDGDGNASGLTLSLTGVGISGLVAASASNLNGGLSGTVPYQIAPNITGFTTVGTAGYALVSNGVSAPSWSNTIQNSTYASLAVDVSGGAAGQVLYQSDANNTSFTGVGTLGQVLVSGGASAPYWSTSVPAAGVAGSASNISGGVSGNLLYQADVGLTHYVNNGTSGQLLRSQGSAAPVWATVTAADVGSLPLDGSTAMAGNLSMGSHTITNLLNPLASTDAANKAYVDSVATGLKLKSACRVASTTTLVLSGLIAVDGITVNNADRVLVKNQSFQDQNGIYVASATSWTRATDADTWEELVGATCFITEGSTQAKTTWASNITAGGTIGITPITFVLFGESASYTAGTGLTLIGSQFALATPVSVANGGSGVTTLTGIVKGNGASAFTAATGADVVSLIGATAVQNATTAGSCSGNALTATTLQAARTINGVSFNGSANITVTANTTGSLNVVSNGLGDVAPFSFNGSVTRDLSYNSIGAAAVGGSNATGTWPISITGNAANISGIVGTVNGGTGYASYAIGDLLYASAPTVLSKLPIGSSDRILRSTGSVPSWGQVELNTTVVTGTLPTTRGGTGLAAPFGTLGALYANTSTTITNGILPASYGGTGAATLTGYVKGNGTSAMTAVASIPNTDVSGLGTLSTQNANVVTITGGTITGITDLAIADGGTGASTASTARSNLGIGTVATINTTGSTTNFLRADGTWQAPESGSSMYITVNGFTQAAINTAITAANLAPGSTVFFPAGTYTVTSTIVCNDINIKGVGGATRIIGSTASLGASNPIFKLSSICSVSDIYAAFDAKPSSASAGQYVIFWLGNTAVRWYSLQRPSYINYIITGVCGTAFYNPNSLPTQDVSTFSVAFSNLRVEFFTYRGFDFQSLYRTGNVYSNIYIAAGVVFAESFTSLTISTGSKTLTTSNSTSDFVVGQLTTISSQSNPLNAMYGTITSKTSNSVTVNVTSVIGSGTLSSWFITARNTCNCLFALAGHESESSITQLNIEHSVFTQAAVILDSATALSVGTIHIEQVTPASNNLPFIYTNASAGTINSLCFLGNWYPGYLMPTTTGNSIFQCNSAFNTYGGTNNTLTANYFNIGEFYIANSSETNSWTMFSRGTDNGPMYIEVGGYQYAGSNNNFYANFPTSGNLTFINNGYNVTSPLQSCPGRLTVGTNVPNQAMLTIGTTTPPTYTSTSMLAKYATNSSYVWACGPVVDDFLITQNSGSYLGVKLTWGSTAWTTASDETKKDIIEPIDDALLKIKDVRAVIGKFKTDEPGTRRSFLIAQDFENVFPEAVDTTAMGDEEVLGLRYTDVIPLLVAAIKELSAKVEALENANNG